MTSNIFHIYSTPSLAIARMHINRLHHVFKTYITRFKSRSQSHT